MNSRLLKYLLIIGLVVLIIFVGGLVNNVIHSLNNFVNENSILFSIIVIVGIAIWFNSNKSSAKPELLPKNVGDLLRLFKFELGSQYEEYEFKLSSKGQRSLNGITYDLYEYSLIGFGTLFNLKPERGVFLLFNTDILEAVFYRFNGNQFETLFKEINNFLPKDKMLSIDPFTNTDQAFGEIIVGIYLELIVKEDGNTGLCMMNNQYWNNRHSNSVD